MRKALFVLLVLLLACPQVQARKTYHYLDEIGALFSRHSDFDYYILALSWSPEFCSRLAARRADKQPQCRAKLGFVIHGLWPQRVNGAYPENCGPDSPVPESIAAQVWRMSPPMPPGDTQLLNHEWRKHGTCSGLNMAEYFTAVENTAAKLKIPELLKAPLSPLALNYDALVNALIVANPGLSADMLKIEVDKQDNVSGIQICFSKTLSWQSCPGGVQRRGGTFLPIE